MKSPLIPAIAASVAIVSGCAVADPLSVEALLTPQEQMKFDFADGSNHLR